MENEISLDIGEEIISRLKEIIERLNKILDLRNEKEYTIASSCGNRTF